MRQQTGKLDWAVAPHAGAWIEIFRVDGLFECYKSRPTRARGLKCAVSAIFHHRTSSRPTRARGLKCGKLADGTSFQVAPHAGAWIEMPSMEMMKNSPSVAPHAGAWIEIKRCSAGRNAAFVAPHAGAWIEILADKPRWIA